MIDWKKLKHEWMTATLAVVTVVVGAHDLVVEAGYDLTPFIPDKYKPYAIPAIGIAMLALRKWKDRVEPNQ